MAEASQAGRQEAASERQGGLVTLLFTDIVGSTALKQLLGDHAGVALMQEHHALVRQLLREFARAEEISTAGDSFLLLFIKPSDAVRFALLLQSNLREFNQTRSVPLHDRVGLHLGEVMIEQTAGKRAIHGMQVDICARVMSLAQAGQILMTRPVFDNARQSLRDEELKTIDSLCWLNHGRFELKGVRESLEICEVRSTQAGTTPPPVTSEKARRVEAPGTEAVLGWRPAIGQVVPNSQWVLEKQLGEGDFGEVWLGRHRKLKEGRVFKFCFQADRVRRLKREMTLFRLIKERIGDHPHIVGLRDVYFDQPPYYVEEDYVEGLDLANWYAAQGGAEKVALETKLEIVAQVADALQAAHDAGVVHRGVAPANILVAQIPAPGARVTAKLTGFGIGHVVSEQALEGVTRAGFTQTLFPEVSSSHTGSQMYLAPELLAGRPASIASDVYALGVVLFQMLVNDFRQPVTTDWMRQVTDPLLSEDLQQCFAGDPQERFAGAARLGANLRSLAPRRAALAEHQRLRHLAARRRSIALASLAVAAGLILLAAAVFYAWR